MSCYLTVMFHIKRIPSVRAAISGTIKNLNKKVLANFFRLHLFHLLLLTNIYTISLFTRSASLPARSLSVAVISSFSLNWTIFAFLIFYLLDILHALSFRAHSFASSSLHEAMKFLRKRENTNSDAPARAHDLVRTFVCKEWWCTVASWIQVMEI